MNFTSNIQIFADAATTSSAALIKAYCGLVAIELVLKHEVNLRSHNIPQALATFKNMKAVGRKSIHVATLNSLRQRLVNDLTAISTQNRDGAPCAAPSNCYPYIRYTRFTLDGWGIPDTPNASLATLAATVDHARYILKTKFGLPL